jgi:hypothetical protein
MTTRTDTVLANAMRHIMTEWLADFDVTDHVDIESMIAERADEAITESVETLVEGYDLDCAMEREIENVDMDDAVASAISNVDVEQCLRDAVDKDTILEAFACTFDYTEFVRWMEQEGVLHDAAAEAVNDYRDVMRNIIADEIRSLVLHPWRLLPVRFRVWCGNVVARLRRKGSA